ncbi:uncharacterized protein [Ptychodera flava]|uniref:uncharacterized protein isoform X1 n=1 Tax=Ptychodera flava TaxID=63121 RepID=UPI00396A8A12
MKWLYLAVLFVVVAKLAEAGGFANIAIGKKIKGKGKVNLRNVVDGDKETCGETSKLPDGKMTIDLLQEYKINRIRFRMSKDVKSNGVARIRVGNSLKARENEVCARVRNKKGGFLLFSKCGATGRYIIVEQLRDWGNANLCELEALIPRCKFPVKLSNAAENKEFFQQITKAALDVESRFSFYKAERIFDSSWLIDLGEVSDVYEVTLINRDTCNEYPVMDTEVRVGNDGRPSSESNGVCNQVMHRRIRATREKVTFQCGCETPMKGRYVTGTVQKLQTWIQHVCALQVMTG